MLTPRSTQPPSDNDSLQADVMRFMAIIAFCLIAILALVKEAAPVQAQMTATVTQAPAPQAPAATPEPAIEPVSVAAPVSAIPPFGSWREPIPHPVSEEEQPAPTKKPDRQPPPLQLEALHKPASVAPPVAAEPTPAEPVTRETAEEGLSLRFASDGDFLRLIARGDIKVYAFNGSDVLGLNNAYEFLTARTPGKVYELLPQTIPALIFDSLTRSLPQPGASVSYNWGITLPGRIESQISDYVATARSGQLVIDKYGDVHHVAQN